MLGLNKAANRRRIGLRLLLFYLDWDVGCHEVGFTFLLDIEGYVASIAGIADHVWTIEEIISLEKFQKTSISN